MSAEPCQHCCANASWYCSATAGVNTLTVISVVTPSFPLVLRVTFTIPNIALMNIMVCRALRQVRFGVIDATPTTMPTLFPESIRFQHVSPPSSKGSTDVGNAGVLPQIADKAPATPSSASSTPTSIQSIDVKEEQLGSLPPVTLDSAQGAEVGEIV